tara:strand:- start:68 stop:1168 length:1101 start_codon:yes stop_codon:yes gene_type:complete
MHFTFTYIPHHIEKLQEYLDFLFFEVWMNAEGDFGAEKLAGHPELQQIYIDLGSTEGKWAQFFNSSIENIYREFLELEEDYKEFLTAKYENNNNIEGLCCDKNIEPITYDEIAQNHPKLALALKYFYSRLYGSNSPFNLEVFGFLNKTLIGEYDSAFMEQNNKQVCPYCALTHLKANNHSYREAYDHYIPKGSYPFNVLNFRNLSPMCNECNSTYKLSVSPLYPIDPLKGGNQRTKAFYPYADCHPEFLFKIEINNSNILDLKPNDISIVIETEGDFEEEIETWLRVFGIEERYKASLCSPNDGIFWFSSIADEFENAVEQSEINDANKFYEKVLKVAEKYPLSEKGFLKSGFLKACKKRGLFDSV